MTVSNQVLTGGNSRVTVEWSSRPTVGGAISQKFGDLLDKASGDQPASWSNRNYTANTVSVANGYEWNGVQEPARVATNRDPVMQFFADEKKEYVTLPGEGRLDRAVSELDQASQGLASLTPTHVLPLESGTYLGDVSRGSIRVILEGERGAGSVFHYGHGAAVPSAVMDVVSSAQKIMRRV